MSFLVDTIPGLLLFHAVMAIALRRMASRTGDHPRWFALVPFLNMVLFLRIAKRPDWWLALFFIPAVNLITLVVATRSVCRRFGIHPHWGLLALFSPLNMALYLYAAYGTRKDPSVPVPASA